MFVCELKPQCFCEHPIAETSGLGADSDTTLTAVRVQSGQLGLDMSAHQCVWGGDGILPHEFVEGGFYILVAKSAK